MRHGQPLFTALSVTVCATWHSAWCDLQALVTSRALNPEQYAEAEKQRLDKRAAELDAALAKERQRRSHAAKLRGVLNTLDEQCSEASLQLLLKGASR